MNYTLLYNTLFGGVTSMSRKHFESVNGYSNQFWGWGGEDDDMWNRIRHARLNVSRYHKSIAR
jgi:predicted glycosyltransferase involved in capsule biosynthesis